MKRNYPEKFVVKSKCMDYQWDVSWNGYTYDFKLADGTLIADCTAGYMDERMLDEGYEFIFPEPKLVFPFTVRTNYDNIYLIEKDCQGVINMIDSEGRKHPRTEQKVREFIKQGLWIVTSVGNQKPTKGTLQGSAITSNKLTVKIDAEAATESMNALAEAIESVNIGLESMQKLMAEMGLGGKAREDYTDGSLVNCLVFGEFKETNG